MILPLCRRAAGVFLELPVTMFGLTAMTLLFRDRIQSDENTVLCLLSNADLEYTILLTSLCVFLLFVSG